MRPGTVKDLQRRKTRKGNPGFSTSQAKFLSPAQPLFVCIGFQTASWQKLEASKGTLLTKENIWFKNSQWPTVQYLIWTWICLRCFEKRKNHSLKLWFHCDLPMVKSNKNHQNNKSKKRSQLPTSGVPKPPTVTSPLIILVGSQPNWIYHGVETHLRSETFKSSAPAIWKLLDFQLEKRGWCLCSGISSSLDNLITSPNFLLS